MSSEAGDHGDPINVTRTGPLAQETIGQAMSRFDGPDDPFVVAKPRKKLAY